MALPRWISRTRAVATAAGVLAFAGASCAAAEPLTVAYRNSYNLPAAAIDQHGVGFTVAGMSGLAWIGGASFVAVMDNSNKLVFLEVTFGPDGAVTAASITQGFSIADTHDFEGIAWTGPERNSVLLAEEGTPAVHEYSLIDGARLATFAAPPVFGSRRANFGFESLAATWNGASFWTANEEALTVDGPLSTATAGTVVRLLRFAAQGLEGSGPWTAAPAEQFAYVTQPLHGVAISGARSGVSELVAVPDGRMLVLERSLAFSPSGLLQSRIYALDTAAATQLAGTPLEPGLNGQSYAAAAKTPLWTGSVFNMEGLCVGPPLAAGRRVLLGVVDDGDPVSVNALVAFELTGVRMPGDLNCDAVVNNFDIDPFVQALLDASAYAAAHPRCDRLNGDVDASGAMNNFDIDPFVACLLSGCP